MALLAAPVAAQQGDVVDPGKINDFRLDQPAGPGEPVRRQPAASDGPTTPTTPASTPSQPKPKPVVQTARPAAKPAAAQAPLPKPAAAATPSAVAVPSSASAPATEKPLSQGSATDPLAADPALPAVSEGLPDTPLPDTPLTDPLSVEPEAEAVTAAEGGPASDAMAQFLPYWPYAVGALAIMLLAAWLLRRRSAAGAVDAAVAVEPAPAPTLDLTPSAEPTPVPAAPPQPERKAPPSGTVGVSAAKLFGAPPAQPVPHPAPSAASQGFVTTRAPHAPRPAAPLGTIGIPASRIALPETPPPPAIELVDGTKLAAQFAAPELIRDADGLRLKFAIGIGNIGTMSAKEVRVRTVLLTAAPDSDRAIAEWMANPNGPAAATIPAIDSGTQTNITGDIQLSADQIRAMAMQGNAIFVPMFALSVDFLGAEGLDRFGEAYVIGLPPERAASNGAARVLPLPHDETLPRRWTDLVHRHADIAG